MRKEVDISWAYNERLKDENRWYVKEILYRVKCWWVLRYSKQPTYKEPTERVYKESIRGVGFSIDASQWGAYWEAVAVYTITMLMHHYWMSKEEVWEKRPSEVSTLLEMVWCIKNPELLKKYKDLRFNSETEFEHYLLRTMKFV